jgi:hypothetical protein
MSENDLVRPSCVLFLVQASASMDRERLALARLHIDEIIDHLLRRYGSTLAEARNFQVGVIGYSQIDKRKIGYLPLLPDAARTTDLLSLSELSDGVRRQVKLDLLAPAGKARPAEGLFQAHLVLHHWLARHPGARPPLVLHWGDGNGCGSAHARACRSLRLLGSGAGETGLVHYACNPGFERFLAQPKKSLSRDWRRIWRHSTPILMSRRGKSVKRAHALAINADPLPLVRALLRQVRPVRVQISAPASVKLRTLTLVKKGNADDEIEDAFACDTDRSLAAIADGASEGIFTSTWAQLLTRTFLSEDLDVADPERLATWLQQCRHAWKEKINYQALRWSQEAKVDSTGAGSTFLAWQAGKTPEGALVWRSWAVGDSCLFWIRNNRLRATFPMTNSQHFSVPPLLLPTRTELHVPAPLFAAGLCRGGDLFVLATDAVSQFLLRCVERRKEPDWSALESMEESVWRERVEALRATNRMVNDDCTLVFARIS